jgi:hypothetical protein
MYTACIFSKEMLEAAIRATETCAAAEMARSIQNIPNNSGNSSPTPSSPHSAEKAERESAQQKWERTLQEERTLLAKKETKPTPDDNPFKTDIKANYEGQVCSYFTKPMVRQDGSGMNVYADGSFVCHEDTMYECQRRVWKNRGPCSAYQDWKKRTSGVLEGSTLNPTIHGQ